MSNLESNGAAAGRTLAAQNIDLMIRRIPADGLTGGCGLCGRSTEFENGAVTYDYNSGWTVCLLCAESIDKAIADLATGKTELREGDYFGDCPKCGLNDGYLNVHKTHWFVCNTHKTCWCIGSNLFSSWKDEDESIWKKNDETLREYRVVDDWHRWSPSAPDGELEWVTATKAAGAEGDFSWPDELPF